MFADGQSMPLLCSAARARSRASRVVSSGRPTMRNPGRPLLTWTSTWIGYPSAPNTIADAIDANIATSVRHAANRGGHLRRDGRTPRPGDAPAAPTTEL